MTTYGRGPVFGDVHPEITHPVDYETEIARYGKESEKKWDAYFKENPNSMTPYGTVEN